jgi:hypothetical protein
VKDRVSNRSKGYVHTLAMTLATGLTGLFFFFFFAASDTSSSRVKNPLPPPFSSQVKSS